VPKARPGAIRPRILISPIYHCKPAFLNIGYWWSVWARVMVSLRWFYII